MHVSVARVHNQSRVIEAKADMTRPPSGGQSSFFFSRTAAQLDAFRGVKEELNLTCPANVGSLDTTRAQCREEDVFRVNRDPLGASPLIAKEPKANGTGVSGKYTFTA